ncbi:heat shock transcription factor, Y-linked-like [Acipenser ruthenus]|uniref:heat shock transcription factor, Y-linked-like n=1 Tax=Acipenser ruthenus TaxID=7906 RepID=UPI00145C01DB|nr:heat shock transcription factor, Y-linked-like [Acipenser ruthenus]
MAATEPTVKIDKEDMEVADQSSAAAVPSTSSHQFEPIDSNNKTVAKSIFHSVSSICDQTAAGGDSELRSMLEENALQVLTEETVLKKPRLALCHGGLIVDGEFLSLTFPRKLWKIVESEQFKSIKWDQEGNCVVIDEEFFKKDVLERKGPLRIFETDCMKSFIRQLNLYGFSKIRQDYQRSASLSDFLAEEKEAAVLTKFQFYYNPNFRRGCPNLVMRMKRRVGIKSALPISGSQDPEYSGAGQLRAGTSMDQITLEGQQSPHPPSATETAPNITEVPSTSVGAKGANRTASSSLSPLATPGRAGDHGGKANHLPQLLLPHHGPPARSTSHAMEASSSTTTAAASVYHFMPQVPAPGFGPMMGFPGFSSMYPDLATMQAHLASWLPFCNPWFSMPMMAAASAFSMSGSLHHHRALPHHHHCTNCNCTSPSGPPSTRGAPRNPEYMGPNKNH